MVDSLHFLGAIGSFRRGAQSGAKWVPYVDLRTTKLQKKMFRGLSLCVNPQARKESSLSLKDELHVGTRSIWSCRDCKFSENVLHFAPKTSLTWHFTVPCLEHLHQRPVGDLAKIFFTSKLYLLTFFPTPPIKLKLGLQVHERLLIATHLDESNYLTNQKQGAVNKYDLSVSIDCSKAPWELWKLWFCSVSQQSSTWLTNEHHPISIVHGSHIEHWWRCFYNWFCTRGYRIEITYVYCIVMYSSWYIYIFMYNYYATSFFYHGFHTFINFVKTFKNKLLIFFTSRFHKILHSYNFFSSNEIVYKGPKHRFIYWPKKIS